MPIRRFQPADLPRLVAITVSAFEGVSIDHHIEQRFGIIAGHDWKWRKARHIEDDARANADGIFVFVEDDALVGYVTTRVDHDSGIGQIPNLAIDEAHRGRGIGRLLIEHALDDFRSQGLTHAKIETLDQNSIGSHLYPACGFEEVARQIHYVRKL